MIEKSIFIELLEKFKSNQTGKKSIKFDFKKAIIVGDIHADLHSLKYIIERIKKVGNAIFLGDYADRGEFPIETYYEILKLSNECNIILLRGNHETDYVFPHDLPFYINSYFNDQEVYEIIKDIWERMPIIAYNDDYFFVHGGIPTNKNFSIENLKNEEIEFLWNDPWENDEDEYNFERGIGYFFGKETTRNFLNKFNFKCIIRSHQPRKILLSEQEGMIVTIGSCIRPYFLNKAGFLEIDFYEKIKNGNDVIKKFGRIFLEENLNFNL
ncbi:MAG: metallophosphoesterase family protein [Candidatus Altarchaeaceae archaeon]